jgi:hypothetical protein
MMESIPWDWRTWGEYKKSCEAKVRTPVNVAAYCGHVTLRLAVMGADAWTRVATPAEIETMCGLLDEALVSGALGLSSNLLDYDKQERPLPPMVAEVNRFTPTGLPDDRYNALYQDNGILGLLRTGQDGVYDAVVWKLAMHIQRIHHFYEVEASVLSSVDGLRTTFGKEDG